MDRLSDLTALMGRHIPKSGMVSTAIRRLSLFRLDQPSGAVPAVYEASLCLIAQGKKRVSLGTHSVVYDASHYLLVSVDLPLVGHVLEAAPDAPYLCCKIDLDLTVVADLTITEKASPKGDLPVLAAYPSDPDLVDAAFRLVKLLDRPEEYRRACAADRARNPLSPVDWATWSAAASDRDWRQSSQSHRTRDCDDPQRVRSAAARAGHRERRGHERLIAARTIQGDHPNDATGVSEAASASGGTTADAGGGDACRDGGISGRL